MISIVITNYNGAHLLKKNLPKVLSLLEKSKLEHEIIVVDDHSTDDSLTVLTTLSRGGLVNGSNRLQVISKEKNEGFASTVDMGIRAAKGEYVFTLKTDTVPEKPEYFQLLLDHFNADTSSRAKRGDRSLQEPIASSTMSPRNDNRVFAVSATLKTIENGKEELRGCGQIYFEKGYFLHRRKSPVIASESEATGGQKQIATSPAAPRNDDLVYSSWADGSASVFNKVIYERIGGFDHLYNPFYWEDTDLGYRAWKAGYTIEFEPKAVLVHDFEKGAINSHYTKDQQKAVSLRNQFIFVWKNADLKHLIQYFLWEEYHHAIAIKNGQHDWIKIYWQAAIKWPQIIQRRVAQKKINRFSDDQVLSMFRPVAA